MDRNQMEPNASTLRFLLGEGSVTIGSGIDNQVPSFYASALVDPQCQL
jgi:hypothetical protein